MSNHKTSRCQDVEWRVSFQAWASSRRLCSQRLENLQGSRGTISLFPAEASKIPPLTSLTPAQIREVRSLLRQGFQG